MGSVLPLNLFAHISIPCRLNSMQDWAMVVAQLVERSLPFPEVRGSNPVIGKNLD